MRHEMFRFQLNWRYRARGMTLWYTCRGHLKYVGEGDSSKAGTMDS